MFYNIPPRKLRRLGDGGFGSVWLVEHPHLRGQYAMKELHADWIRDTSTRDQFFTEATLWIALGAHPNLVNMQNVGMSRERDVPYIMMEYVRTDAAGRTTLADHLRGGCDSLRAVQWVVQCCDGLEFAAANGIRCHRDLKPGNILITPEGVAKVGDFGLAVFAGFGVRRPPAAARAFGVAGTPPYMAPEQFMNPSAVSATSDIYALGVILYQIIAGRLPIAPAGADLTFADWERAHLTQFPQPVQSPFWPVAERCLARFQRDRYGSYAELRTALDRARVSAGCHPTPSAVTPTPTASDWNNRGSSLSALGRPQEALTCYRQALLMDAAFAKAWCNLGACLKQLGQSESAREAYARAQSLDPTLGAPWSARGHELHLAGEHEQAIQCYDRALALEPDDRITWHDRGIALARVGRLNEAVRSLRHALRLDPDSTFTRSYLAQYLGALGAHRDAIAVYGEILERRPTAEIHACQAEQHADLGEIEEARAGFREALKRDECCQRAHVGLGVLADRTGEAETALVHFEVAIRCDPANGRVWHLLADLQRRQDLLDRAVASYAQALILAPERGNVWADAGACLDELGRAGEAHVHYREALRLNPNDWAAWWNRAALEARVGLVDEAVASYEHVISTAGAEQRDAVRYATDWIAAHRRHSRATSPIRRVS